MTMVATSTGLRISDGKGNSITINERTHTVNFKTPNGMSGQLGPNGWSLSAPGVSVAGDQDGNLSVTASCGPMKTTLREDGSYTSTATFGPVSITTEGPRIGEVSSGTVSIGIDGYGMSSRFYVNENGHMIVEERVNLPGLGERFQEHNLTTPQGIADSIEGRAVNAFTSGLVDKIRDHYDIEDEILNGDNENWRPREKSTFWDDLTNDIADALRDMVKGEEREVEWGHPRTGIPGIGEIKFPKIGIWTNSFFRDSRNFVQRSDPLVLDLDGDGIETIGIGSKPVLFDFDGDGSRTGTGWLKGDDAFVVLDRNGNGVIDNGSELFGVDTVLKNGQKASSGFTALADLDSNSDGVFDSRDALYAQTKLWQDLNQDGISQANELKTLAQAGIASINLAHQASNTLLAGGNLLSGQGDYTKTNGEVGTVGEFISGSAGNLDLASNPFYREFDKIALCDAAKKLPGMQGSGAVRDLQEAASLNTQASAKLLADLEALAGNNSSNSTNSRAEMIAAIDTLLADWANTSTLKTSSEQAKDNNYQLVYLTPGATINDYVYAEDRQYATGNGSNGGSVAGFSSSSFKTKEAFNQQQAKLAQLISILERFNGLSFVNVGNDKVTTGAGISQGKTSLVNNNGNNGNSGVLTETESVIFVTLTAQQLALLEQSYAQLKESVYSGLVLQTRLKGYLDEINLSLDGSGLNFDYSGLEAKLNAKYQIAPIDALIDRIELMKYAQGMTENGWHSQATLQSWISQAHARGDWDAALATLGATYTGAATESNDFRFMSGKEQSFNAGNGDDTVIGSAGNDVINGGAGNDQLFGGAGNDKIEGGDGNDTIDGGEGNDTITDNSGFNTLKGGAGNDTISGNGVFEGGTGDDSLNGTGYYSGDTYLFNVGDGKDTITDYGGTAAIDTLSFGAGINASSVVVWRSGNDMVFQVSETDQVSIKEWFANSSRYIEKVQFADGTEWTLDTLRNMAVATVGSANGDSITGWNGSDVIDGAEGNDTINGGAGNDQLFGGAGNDKIEGGDGNDTIDGGEGNDTITDNSGFNTLKGGAGNDTISGIGIFEGGTGNDNLNGTGYYSGDTYLFNVGDGKDTITDYGGTAAIDTLSFGAGINASSVVVWRSGNDMVFQVSETDQVSIKEWFANSSRYIEKVQFADGTEWTLDTLRNMAVATVGSANGDSITGWNGSDVIDGAEGNDTINGGAGNDQLFGGAGNDKIEGGDGNDTIDGGEGNDTITDNSGFNTLKGGAGNDTISGIGIFEGGTGNDNLNGTGYYSGDTYLFNVGDGKDTITDYGGTAAIDTLSFGAGINASSVVVWRSGNDMVFQVSETDQVSIKEWFANSSRYIEKVQFADGTEWTLDTLRNMAVATVGSANGDSITGWNGSDVIDGAEGNDTINGGAGNDQLFGGAGNDKIEGGDGNDTIDGGEGNDTITDNSGFNTLKGGAGNDTISGIGIFEGGTGNDNLNGTGYYSGDTYLFNVGDGKDTITDYGGTAAIDTLSFGAGINASSVVVWRSGNDMVFQVSETDQVSIKEWFANSSRYIEKVQFADGTEWTLDTLRNMAVATVGSANGDSITGWNGSDVIDGAEGNDTINGGAGNDQLFGGAGNDKIEGGDGNDTIDGGEGNDTITDNSGFNTLKGGAGNDTISGIGIFEGGTGNDNLNGTGYYSGDTYLFNVGDGKDTITDYGGTAAIDTLSFGAGINASSVVVWRSGNDMVFQVSETDQVSIKEWFANSSRYIEKVQFADGTEWTLDTLRNMAVATVGSANGDSITGWNGSDVIDGAEGNDTINGGAGNDQLFGGAGNDKIEGGDGNDTIDGGEGNDTITDNSGFNTLKGGAGNDTISGIGIFEGGTGNDNLNGTGYYSGDTYLFNVGDGKDTITDYGGTAAIDTLSFGAGINASSVVVWRSGNDMVFQVSETDQVSIKEWFANSSRYIEKVQFADGTEWTLDTLRNMAVATVGSANGDSITGWNGSDVIDGAEGNDTINGGAGNDQLFGGAGNDKIEGGDGNDTIDGGEGNDTITDNSGFNTLKGGAGNDTISGIGIFEGGTGNDNLNGTGYYSGDTYLFNVGDGKDTITDYGGTAAIDTLSFGAGINASSVVVWRSGNDMVFQVSETDQVSIKEWFANSSRYIEKVQFADGTEWTLDTLRNMAVATVGSANGDSITGWNGSDVIDGAEGNDTINGGAGNDQLFGGAGNDKIEGGDGNDTIDGGEGNDTITDNSGFNTLKGGAGNDTISGIGIFEGGTGNDNLNGTGYYSGDTYLFNVGDGKDTITDYGGTAAIDTLSFGAGINASSVVVWRSGNDMVFQVSETDQVSIKEWFANSSRYIEKVQFADGTEWTLDTLRNMAVATVGSANGDSITGWNGSDVIDGAEGNDTINGGAGNDQLFGGAGNDKIEGGDGNDTIDGGEGNDTITDNSGFNTLKGGAGNDTISGIGIFEGGTGNDNLNGTGYYSGDTYLFNVGDGKDTITDYGGTAAIDTLSFGAGINASSVVVWRSGNDMVFQVSETDQVSIKEWFANSSRYIEKVQFADGTEWTLDTLRNMAVATVGSANGDSITGWNGSDVIDGAEGNDTINGGAGNDQLFGGAGNDKIEGGDGNDTIDGGEGNDTITDNSGFNTLKGGAGNDTISGIGIFEGGTGNDNLNGTGYYSGDTYLFNVGDGKDTITDYGGTAAIDTLSFGAGINASSVVVWRSGNDMVFQVSETDQVSIKEWFANSSRYIEKVQFADGTEWTLDTLRNMAVATVGSANGDSITGWNGSDVIDGAEGNDTINGGAGNDQLFGGAGNDKIEGGDGNDTIDGGEGNDTITDNSGFNTLKGGAGNDTISGIGIFEGGTGNDNLNGTGYYSGDTYLFNVGDGKDTITDYGGTAAIDTLSFGAGINASSVVVWRSGNDMVFQVSETDQVSIKEWFANSSRYIEKVQFADGTEWTLDTLRNMAVATVGSANGDSITGWNGSDVIDGAEGNDTINGGAGNDQLFGGAGNDKIEGGDGNDTIDGGEGNDTITDNSGFNTLKGGAGNDTISGIGIFEGGTGNDNLNGTGYYSGDTYLFNVGDGKDTITDYGGTAAIDTLSFGAGINASSVVVWRSGNDMVFQVSETDQVSIKEWFANSSRYIEKVQFADGTEWTLDTLRNMAVATVGSANGDSITGWNGSDVIDGAEGNDTINGGAGNDQLFGGAGNDKIEGGDGNDTIDGGEGNDTITDNSGFNTLKGGAGNDTISGIGIFEGGTGNDIINTGTGNDLIAFNKGDGFDSVNLGSGSKTLSLGGELDYASLSFKKSGNHLILETGTGEGLSFANWYAGSAYQNVVNLQVIAAAMDAFNASGSDSLLDHHVESFNFKGLVADFDAARSTNPGIDAWALSNALLDRHLGESNSAALGGDIAYQYGVAGKLGALDASASQAVLGDKALGSQMQALRPTSALQDGIKLA